MKLSVLPVVLLAAALGACSAPAVTTTAATATATVSSPRVVTQTATPRPTVPLEPTTLKEALAIANKEHTEPIAAVGAMEDLYRQAEPALKPGMTDSGWYKIEIIRINTSLGMLKDTLSDREVILGVKQYVAMMEAEAIRQGKA